MAKKEININSLQNNISKVLRQVGKGDVYEVIRYSKPVAYLISKKDYEHLVNDHDCKKCLSEIRQVARMARENTSTKNSERKT